MASEDRDDRDEPSRIMDVLADAFDIAGAKQQMREAECARDGHQWRTPHMPSLPEHEQAWLSANDHIYGRCKKVEYDAILTILFTLAVTTGGIPQATAHPSTAVLSSMPVGLSADAARAFAPDPVHQHAVPDPGYTVYTDDMGATATGAVPDDAVLGYVPPAKGEADGPDHATPGCEQPTPQGLRDHATFSDAELDRFGLPRLAALGGDVAHWQDVVRAATGRACATHVSYQDGKPIIAGNLPRQQANAPVALPAQPRRADWQANFAFQTTSLGSAWSGWADDAVNYTWNGYYVGMEGYAHIPVPGADPHVFVDLSTRHVATWLGVGGFFGGCGQDQPEMVQGGAESFYDIVNGTKYNLFVENTGNPRNCAAQIISGLGRAPLGGELLYMAQGCGYVQAECNYMFVQDQSMSASPNYWGGYTGGNVASMTSAECIVENYSAYAYLAHFGTVTFEYCRTVYTRFGVNAEAGIGNIPGGFYRVFADWDYSGDVGVPCVFVNNFTDANNWTFSIDRNNDDAGASCKGYAP